MDNEKVLEIKNLSVSYGNNLALVDINLIVNKGDFLAIIGGNGGGKSTLLKAILGLVEKDKGTISAFGKENSTDGIGYVPQFSLLDRNFPITVLDAVLSGMLKKGLHLFFRFSKKQKEDALEYLKLLQIDHLAKRQISELSGGEFQRMLIARALATKPSLLLLDEPTASVDPSTKEYIYDLLTKLNEEITIIIVTHDTLAISSKVKSIACLNRTLVYHGEPSLSKEIIEKIYGCPVDLIAHGVPHRVLSDHECCCGGDHHD